METCGRCGIYMPLEPLPEDSTMEIHKKKDGFMLIDTKSGAARYMTWWESIKYRLFGTEPEMYS